jgi:class 3 adenylate cyclase/tetratricopeptide (TPR) repeat protein
MRDDLRAGLVANFLDYAQAAAARRDWTEVLDVAEDILILDPDHPTALTLRTLAERYVERGEPEWGRRQETILFADLVGSTELANRYDPEFVRRLVRSYELACTPVLAALGGHAHRFLGDGILASFGYPTAHEDDARRAVQAGLDIVRAVADAASQHRETGAELQVKVGIASGLVVHCNRGGGVWTQTGDLFGTVVNLASRLQDLASPGSVCISSETAELVEGHFDLESLGLFTLKGFAEPVPVYRALERDASVAWGVRRGEPASPFIGRERELELLQHRFTTVASRQLAGTDPSTPRRSGGVLITGDAGIGKSRLCQELLQRTASEDRALIELQCSSYRLSSPLYPVRAALERYAGMEPGDDNATRRDKLAAIVPADALPFLALLIDVDLGPDVPRPELFPIQLREVTLGHLMGIVERMAAARPLILFVEDVHWGDPTTCDLIERIVSADFSGVLTVVTARTPQGWLERVGFNHVRLEAVSHAEARTLARFVAGEGFSGEMIDQIAARSDGIPLFVEQLAGALKLSSTDGQPPVAIPRTLSELLQARVDAMGSSKRIAQLAATIGREFEPELLEDLARALNDVGALPPLDRPLDHHLDRLLDGRLIERSGDEAGHLRFRHALVGQAAYESQLMEERAERHGALADVLVRGDSAGRPADPAVVAFHFDRAGRVVEAATYYFAAAGRAQAVGALVEVVTHLTRVEEIILDLDEPLRGTFELSVRLMRGMTAQALVGYGASNASDDFARALELCDRLKDVPGTEASVLQALFGLWCMYYATGDLRRSEEVTAAIQDQLEIATMPAGRPSYHSCKGVELFCLGDLAASERHFDAAIGLFAEDDVDPAFWRLPNDPLAAVYAFLSPLRLFQGDEEAALHVARLGVERSRDLEFPRGPFSIAFVRTYEAWMHRERGAIPEAIEAADEATRLGEQSGFSDWATAGRMHKAAALVAESPTMEGLEDLGRAIAAFRVGGAEWTVTSVQLDRGWGYVLLGDLEQAEACLQDAEEVIGHLQRTSVAEAHRLRAELRARRFGADDAVASELATGMRLAMSQGAPLYVLRAGATFERWFGPERLDRDLRAAYEAALAIFGPDLAARRRFLGAEGLLAADPADLPSVSPSRA